MDDALELAKSKVGGAVGLARQLGGLTSQAVSQWKKVPPNRVLDVERVTGVSRYRLRPDLYGDSPPPAEAELQPTG
jgi:DNA-binding transcriptional regulator YdaS (Cro superfamily)